jgi:MFS family permease
MAFVWNLIGQGLGPVIVGFFSDTFGRAMKLSQSADVLGLCRQAACADASATGLQYGLIAITAFYLLSAALFWMSSRRMRTDLVAD